MVISPSQLYSSGDLVIARQIEILINDADEYVSYRNVSYYGKESGIIIAVIETISHITPAEATVNV